MSFFDELFGKTQEPVPTATPVQQAKPNAAAPVTTLTPTIKIATATPPQVKKSAITGYDVAAPFIQRKEGFRGSPYLDTNGELAIGFGQQFIDGKRVTKGMKITEEQARTGFKEEYDRRRKQIEQYPNVANMGPYQEARFMDVVWNASPDAIKTWPKIQAILKSNDKNELKKLDAELLTIRKGKINGKSEVIPALEARRKEAQKELADK